MRNAQASVSHRLSGCARIEAGELVVAGVGSPAPTTQKSPWLAFGPLGRLDVLIVGPLSFDAEAGAMFRTIHDLFYVVPRESAYEVPIAGFEAGAGLALSFP